MLSRKQFIKNLLMRGLRAASDFYGEDENCRLKQDESRPGFDLPSTELSPSLLSIEAECRGLDPREGSAEELRREVYRELVQNRLRTGPDQPR